MKSTIRTLALLIGIGLLVGGLSACKKETGVSQTDEGRLVLGAVEQTETVERGVALAGRMLVLDGFHGTVSLIGTGGETARLTFTKRARGRDTTAAANALGRITLDEAGDAESYQYVLRTHDPDLSSVDIQGEVPRKTSLRLQLASGHVTLSGIDGPVEVTLDGGSVEIGGAGESVTVETRNGSIRVGLYRLPSQSTLRLHATNGNVTLTLPGSVDARVTAQTSAGAITTEGLTFLDQHLNPDGAGARFQGSLGSGSATIDLRTKAGSIVLQEGSVRFLPQTTPAETETDVETTPAETETDVETTPAETEPDVETAPTDTTQVPTDTTQAPTDTTQAPTDTTQAPTDTTQAPTDTTEVNET